MAFAVEHHESPLPPNTLPPLHRRHSCPLLYVQAFPPSFVIYGNHYSINHGQTNSSRTSALRPVMQPTFPQDVRTFSASPYSPTPRAHIPLD